jgi:hypothetical protein
MKILTYLQTNNISFNTISNNTIQIYTQHLLTQTHINYLLSLSNSSISFPPTTHKHYQYVKNHFTITITL